MEPLAPVLHASRTLDLDACCATARPADGGATVAIGTYTLQEQGTRDGILYFFQTAAAENALVVRFCQQTPRTMALTADTCVYARVRLFVCVCVRAVVVAQEVGRVHTAGIFDARWGAVIDVVALACADGTVAVCPMPSLTGVARTTCAMYGAQQQPAPMCTSVDWRSASSLAACAQDGQAHLIELREVRRGSATCCARALRKRPHRAPMWRCRSSQAPTSAARGRRTTCRHGSSGSTRLSLPSCSPAAMTQHSNGAAAQRAARCAVVFVHVRREAI
jgi:hypothetical protein